MGYWECDDGNIAPLDGCGPDCRIEYGYECTGGDNAGVPDKCSPVCGDGFVTWTEACDDGDLDLGDGCDNKCAIEDGWKCSQHHAAKASVCLEICGDGKAL